MLVAVPAILYHGAVELFLGYDPGGDRKHGVAAVRITEDGTLE